MDIKKPTIFTSQDDLPKGCQIIEGYDIALKELFFVDHPQFKKGMPGVDEELSQYLDKTKIDQIWVYYPWKNIAVHTVEEDTFYKLRTARNKNLITLEEQTNFRNTTVGIAGLSVGSSTLEALVMSGGPKKIKIADFDTIELTNLNRLKASLLDLGSNKAHVAAKRAWELDPFLEIEIWDKGLNNDNLREFVFGDNPVNVFIDAMDSFNLKLKSRYICREFKIPVLMATDNGDDVLLDVERFDEEPDRKIFHGLIEEINPEELSKLSFPEFMQLALKIIGPENHTPKLQDSILELGKNISGIPQLGPTASLAGSVTAYTIRRMANKQEVKSGKFWISLEEKIEPNYTSPEMVNRRNDKTNEFINSLNKK